LGEKSGVGKVLDLGEPGEREIRMSAGGVNDWRVSGIDLLSIEVGLGRALRK